MPSTTKLEGGRTYLSWRSLLFDSKLLHSNPSVDGMQMSYHPAQLTIEELLQQVESTRTRRSGPGGQHRNKVESAVVLVHIPSGIKAEANERRSQHENRRIAIQRLRIQLAMRIRLPLEEDKHELTHLWRSRNKNGQLSINQEHEDFPAILCEALDVLKSRECSLSKAASALCISTSQLTKLIKRDPLVWQHINQQRKKADLPPIR